jgi:hypothetical protein
MKISKSQDELIRQALREAYKVEQAELLRDYDTSPLSPDFEDRLKARLQQVSTQQRQSPTPSRHKRWIPLRYLIAAILVLVMMLSCTTVMACPVLRERVVRFFTKEDAQRGNTHYTAVVEGEERRAFDIPAYYTLSEVPEGFVPIVSREASRYVDRMWMMLDNEPRTETYIAFEQIPLNSLYILSTEGCTKETVTLDGHEATLYTKPSAQILVWHTEDCMFVLMYWGADTQDLDIWALADNIVPSESQPLSPPTV